MCEEALILLRAANVPRPSASSSASVPYPELPPSRSSEQPHGVLTIVLLFLSPRDAPRLVLRASAGRERIKTTGDAMPARHAVARYAREVSICKPYKQPSTQGFYPKPTGCSPARYRAGSSRFAKRSRAGATEVEIDNHAGLVTVVTTARIEDFASCSIWRLRLGQACEESEDPPAGLSAGATPSHHPLHGKKVVIGGDGWTGTPSPSRTILIPSWHRPGVRR